MSVINQMLRDLEQRKNKEAVAEHYIDEVNIIAKKQLNIWWVLLVLVLVLPAGIYFYFISIEKSSKVISLHPDKEVLLTLPVDISEVKKQEEKKIPDLIPVIERTESPKSVYKQPTVKTKIELKPSVKFNEQEETVTQTVKVISNPITPAETNRVKEKKTTESRVKIKSKSSRVTSYSETKTKVTSNTAVKVKQSPAKKTVNKKTREQVVYQARELMARDQSAAIQLLKENINIINPDMDYYSLLANLQQRQKQYDDAIISYRKALEIAPQQGELWTGIALAYRGTGEDENAIKAFQQALTTDNLSPELRRYVAEQLNK